MKRLFHLAIGGTTITSEGLGEIENLLNEADWYRHGAYSWFVYADGSLDYWRDRLRQLTALSGQASFFLSEINQGQNAGYLLQTGWEWLNKPR